MKSFTTAVCLALGILGFTGPAPSQDKEGVLTVADSAGRELKLKNWKFTLGTKQLSWLGDKNGLECLQFRDDKPPVFKVGITHFIPVASLRKLDYDHDKKSIAVTVLVHGDKEQTLVGPGNFLDINKINLEGVIEPGANLAGMVALHDGLLKFKSYKFPSPQPVPEATGKAAVIVAMDKAKTQHKASGLVPVYKIGAGYKAVPTLMFQKTLKLDFNKIAKMTNIPTKDKKGGVTHDYDVTLEDGNKQGLTLHEKAALDEGAAELWGLVGRVPTGYKLFPASSIHELRFEK